MEIRQIKLKEAIDHLELFKQDLNELKPNEDFILQDGMKFGTAEALQRLLNYIKEESIPRAVVEEKINKYDEEIAKMEKDDIGIGFTLGKKWSDLKAKREVLQEILKKGE